VSRKAEPAPTRAAWIGREVLSLVVGGGGVFLLGYGLNHALGTGSCSSRGYRGLDACPEGTALWSALLPIGLVVWFAGLFISREGLIRPGAGQLVWTLLFGGLGIAVLVRSAQDAVPGDSRLGAYIMAGIFLPLGLAVLAVGVVQLARAHWVLVPPPPPPGDAPPTAEERLLQLLGQGTVTWTEFNRIKPELDTAGGQVLLGQLERMAGELAAGEIDAAEFEDRKRYALSQ
jgi:hypothetical protein